MIGQLLGTIYRSALYFYSARVLRRNGTAAYFLCNTADYRPLYTYYVAMSSHGCSLAVHFLYISQNSDWLVEGVRSSAVDVVQLMLHAVEACLNSSLACSGKLLSSFSSLLSLWHHCQSSEHWKDLKWLLLLVMILHTNLSTPM